MCHDKKTLYSCENVTKMWNLGDWGCCDPFRWGKPDSWDDQRSGANLRKLFLVFWTRTFMAFMIKDKAHLELFDFCMRFLKMKSWWDSPQHWKCRSISSRCDRRKWKTERIIFVIGESEELFQMWSKIKFNMNSDRYTNTNRNICSLIVTGILAPGLWSTIALITVPKAMKPLRKIFWSMMNRPLTVMKAYMHIIIAPLRLLLRM